MLRLILFLFCFLIFMGCWNKDYNEPGYVKISKQPTSLSMPGSFNRVWSATQAVLAKFPIEKRQVSQKQGKAFVVTDWIRGKSDVFFHGFDVNRIPYVIQYKLYIYLQGNLEGEGVVLTIKNTEQYLDDVVTAGVDLQGSVQTWIKTESSTLKEYALLKQIEKLVQDPKFKEEEITAP